MLKIDWQIFNLKKEDALEKWKTCRDDTSASYPPFVGFSVPLSHPAPHLHCWSRMDHMGGFPCLWLLGRRDQGSHKQETRGQVKSESVYLFFLLLPFWEGWLCAMLRWTSSLSPRSCTVSSIHLFSCWMLCTVKHIINSGQACFLNFH